MTTASIAASSNSAASLRGSWSFSNNHSISVRLARPSRNSLGWPRTLIRSAEVCTRLVRHHAVVAAINSSEVGDEDIGSGSSPQLGGQDATLQRIGDEDALAAVDRTHGDVGDQAARQAQDLDRHAI